MTGSRRYWVVPVGGKGPINLEDFKRDLPQLRAEAKHRFMSGEKWYEVPEYLEQMQDDYSKDHEYSYQINEFLCRKRYEYEKEQKKGSTARDFIVFDEIALYGLEIPTERINRSAYVKIGKALKGLGIETARKKIKGKKYSAVKLLQKSIQSSTDIETYTGSCMYTPPKEDGGTLLYFPTEDPPEHQF